MAMTSWMMTNARTARPRSGMSGIAGMPGRFRYGNHDFALAANVLSCGVAGIGEQGKGGRVSASGEDM